MRKELILIVAVIITCIFLSTSALAITAKIGNLRMTLYPEVGETLEKSIRVINDNDVPVTITLTATGDLEKQIQIKDPEFILQPGQEKQARFTIKTNEAGTFNSKINIGFKPEEGNAAGLVSTITVIAKGKSTGSNDLDYEELSTSEDPDSSFSFNPNPSKDVPGTKSSVSINPLYLFALSPLVLIIILVVLVIYVKKRKAKTKTSKKLTKRSD